MEAEVENFLLKQAVVVVPPCKEQFIVHLFGREEGWVLPACSQLETTKHFYLEGTLQDGRCQCNQGSSATRGLDVLPGPQGCIFDQRTSQVTPFSMGWQNFRIYLSQTCHMENLRQQHATAGALQETSELLLQGGVKGLTQHTTWGGNNGVASVREGKPIPFLAKYSYFQQCCFSNSIYFQFQFQ